MVNRAEAQTHLRVAMANPEADFRMGQWEAIDHIVNQRGKVLCIQRTGWGKSMVYFVAAKLMRAQGQGVTLIISPLLTLMPCLRKTLRRRCASRRLRPRCG